MDLAWRVLFIGYAFFFYREPVVYTRFCSPTIPRYLYRAFERGRASSQLFAKWTSKIGPAGWYRFGVGHHPPIFKNAQTSSAFHWLVRAAHLSGATWQTVKDFHPSIKSTLTWNPPTDFEYPSIALRKQYYRIAPTLRCLFEPEKVRVLDTRTFEWREWAEPGRTIIGQLVEGAPTIHTVVQKITEDFAVTPETARSDIEAFINELSREGWLVPDATS